nr:hypothetical protein [Candidatus Njordarchaeum guaymaensis]
MSLLSQLKKKNANIESLVEKALKDEKALSEVIGGVSSGNARIKYGCAKVLRIIGERNPEVLYPKWDLFANMLSSENTFLKCDAVFILGHLTRVDSENKFEQLFGKFYKLLDDESMITAANLIGVSKVIAKSKPELQSRITDRLLSVDETHHGSECKNVLKGHLILTLDSYFKESKDKKKMLDFVRKELRNTRPSTRKKAEEFLKKWQT